MMSMKVRLHVWSGCDSFVKPYKWRHELAASMERLKKLTYVMSEQIFTENNIRL